jgi:hypothetical protein
MQKKYANRIYTNWLKVTSSKLMHRNYKIGSLWYNAHRTIHNATANELIWATFKNVVVEKDVNF